MESVSRESAFGIVSVGEILRWETFLQLVFGAPQCSSSEYNKEIVRTAIAHS